MTPTIPARVLLRSVVQIVAVVAVLLTVYYLVPIQRTSAALTAVTWAALLALVTLILVFVRQARRINRSRYPLLAGAEALLIILAIFLVGFSFVYLTLSTSTPESFSEPLNRTGALYFSITVLSTVGFGDITPETDGSRLLVAAQMLIDIGLIAGALRIVFGIARRAEQRHHSDEGDATAEVSDRRAT